MTDVLFDGVSQENWNDYQWQMKNSIRSADDLIELFPNINNYSYSGKYIEKLRKYTEKFRFCLTPYIMNMLELRDDGNPDFNCGQLVRLYLPDIFHVDSFSNSSYLYGQENWEMEDEMVVKGSHSFHQKYSDRVCYRVKGCFSICGHCFEVNRVVDRETRKCSQDDDWERMMGYLKWNDEIREFIFSGGEPLILSDEKLDKMLSDLRSVKHITSIRFNTAALVHNPMRITSSLVNMFREYQVTAMGIHVVHPKQITQEFIEAVNRFDDNGYGSILKLAQIPLIKGVNDWDGVLKELVYKLVGLRVKPYYLLHCMPWIMGARKYRTGVYKGVELMKKVYRHQSHVAWPEYVIVARQGKATVPMERNEFWIKEHEARKIEFEDFSGQKCYLADFGDDRRGKSGHLVYEGTPEFVYSDYKGEPVIIFKNWKGKWEMYLDAR